MTGPFEIIVFGVLLVALLLSFLPKKHFARAAFIASGLAFAGFVVVSTFGIPRGPLLPGALLALILPFVTFWRLEYPKQNNWRRRSVFGVYIVLASVLAAVAIILPLSFPYFEPPAPSGAYGVGYAHTIITDESRPETATDDEDDRRALPVQVWYPATVPAGAQALPFIPDPEQAANLMAGSLGLPLGLFDYLADIKGHSYARAPVAPVSSGALHDRFPVLVFSHGFGSIGAQNVLLMEHLASSGYVVFSIEHPYQAAWVRLPGGRSASFQPKGFNEGEITPEKIKEMLALIESVAMAEDEQSYLDRVATSIAREPGLSSGLEIWVGDTAFFLSHLEGGKINAFSHLMPYLDLERTGVLGMSYGGATAGLFCLRDSRCKAGLNMDGLQFGEHDMRFMLGVPFMIMNSDRQLDFEDGQPGVPVNYEMNDFVFNQAQAPIYSLTVGGARHMNYSDFAFLMHAGNWAGMFGPVAPETMNTIMNDYTRAFFDRHLKGQDAPLLQRKGAGYPSVIEFIDRNLPTGQMGESAG